MESPEPNDLTEEQIFATSALNGEREIEEAFAAGDYEPEFDDEDSDSDNDSAMFVDNND
jgi:hypothetical protein